MVVDFLNQDFGIHFTWMYVNIIYTVVQKVWGQKSLLFFKDIHANTFNAARMH